MAATWPISWQNKNKRKADSEVEQTGNKAKYAANCTEQSFQHDWKSSLSWLAFEDGQMTCTPCVTFVKECRSGTQCMPIIVMTHRSCSVILSSLIGNLSQVIYDTSVMFSNFIITYREPFTGPS